MNISKKGIEFIKSFEGFKSYPYHDIGGIPTIGYGTTRMGALPVSMHQHPIDEAEATKILRQDIDATYGAVVDRYVKVDLTQNQFDALVSFTYNLGAHAFFESTLLREINKGNFKIASFEFVKWNHVHGKEVAGLTRRRKAERDMFLA